MLQSALRLGHAPGCPAQSCGGGESTRISVGGTRSRRPESAGFFHEDLARLSKTTCAGGKTR